MLLLSASETFPNGIGNAYDMVGRGFNEHPNVGFYARIPHSWQTLVPTNKIARTHQFYQTYRNEGLGALIPAFRQAWLLPNHILPFRLVNVPRNMMSALGRVAYAALYIGAGAEMKISPANRITLSKSRNDLSGRPMPILYSIFRTKIEHSSIGHGQLIRGWLAQIGAGGVREAEVAWSRHHQGACRMGTTRAAAWSTGTCACMNPRTSMYVARRLLDGWRHAAVPQHRGLGFASGRSPDRATENKRVIGGRIVHRIRQLTNNR